MMYANANSPRTAWSVEAHLPALDRSGGEPLSDRLRRHLFVLRRGHPVLRRSRAQLSSRASCRLHHGPEWFAAVAVPFLWPHARAAARLGVRPALARHQWAPGAHALRNTLRSRLPLLDLSTRSTLEW